MAPKKEKKPHLWAGTKKASSRYKRGPQKKEQIPSQREKSFWDNWPEKKKKGSPKSLEGGPTPREGMRSTSYTPKKKKEEADTLCGKGGGRFHMVLK